MAWIEANGYQVAGPSREVYIQGPESGDPAAYVRDPGAGRARRLDEQNTRLETCGLVGS